MVKINDNLRWKVIRKMEKENNQREVSRKLKINQSTVRKIWLKYLETGTIEDKIKSGRPKILTEREERVMCRVSKQNPFDTASEVYARAKLDKQLSVCSVRRYLRNNSLFGRIAIKKPLLNKGHISKRLKFCKDYLKWPSEKWNDVIFSDESKFERYSMRRRYVRRNIGKALHKSYVCRTVKHGGFSICVWGAIKWDGSKTIALCPTTVNSSDYQNILSSFLPDLYNSKSIFMHDGAPCHRSTSTSKFADDMGICLISDWPPNCPDINIIENLWSIVKNGVSKTCPKNKNELWQIVKNEWDKIDNSVIKNLYSSIPRRLLSVIKCKGYHIKY